MPAKQEKASALEWWRRMVVPRVVYVHRVWARLVLHTSSISDVTNFWSFDLAPARFPRALLSLFRLGGLHETQKWL